ncbi:hypothetical protein CT407_21085 [Salmonella enterica]|nr:hypothetical protein [Salmonella enterica]
MLNSTSIFIPLLSAISVTSDWACFPSVHLISHFNISCDFDFMFFMKIAIFFLIKVQNGAKKLIWSAILVFVYITIFLSVILLFASVLFCFIAYIWCLILT